MLAGVVLFAPHASAPAPARAATSVPPGSPTVAAPTGTPTAYLAWMSGGFPDGVRKHVPSLPGVARSVVVAGDTRWMTVSHAADGPVVDHPPAPYGIPIDAFSVDPGEYAPFLPADMREAVTGTLRAGEGVIGQASADLRRIGVGGSMTFGDATVTVGLVAPDAAVGWSELLVSRDVGLRLGITDERYLLAQMEPEPTDAAFAALIGSLLPDGTPLRVRHTGETPYLRVGSGVDPPVMMKQAFGEFAAHPDPADPAYLTIDAAWVRAHIQTRTVPLLGRITCNRALFPMLIASLREVKHAGLGGLIHTNSGCYAARTVARSPTAPPSNHAYGAAVDINAPENPYGAAPTMDPRIVRIFERHGFLWGGDFLMPDGMHFEYHSG
jgi:D-alanyl-D-alanine carboxypeptidase